MKGSLGHTSHHPTYLSSYSSASHEASTFVSPMTTPAPKDWKHLFCLFLLSPNYGPLPGSSSSHCQLFYHVLIGHWPQNVNSLKSRRGVLGKSVAEEKSAVPTGSAGLFLSGERHKDIRSPRNTTAQLALFHVSSVRSHPPTVPPHKGWKETYRVLHTGFILNQISTGCRLFIKQRHDLPWQELWLTIVLKGSWCSAEATQ